MLIEISEKVKKSQRAYSSFSGLSYKTFDMGKKWLPNPADDPHAMYCNAFVRYCYKEAGRDFIGPEVSVSNTTPEDIAQAGIKAGAIEIYRP